MKVIKKVISIILLTIILITSSGCNQDTGISKNAEIYNYQRFMNTDWGMSPQEALKALNVSEEDCKIFEQTLAFQTIEYKFDYTMDGNKVKISLWFATIDSCSGLAIVIVNSDENDSLDRFELEKMYPPEKSETTFMSLPDSDLKTKAVSFLEDNFVNEFFSLDSRLQQSHLTEIEVNLPKSEDDSIVELRISGLFAMILNSLDA